MKEVLVTGATGYLGYHVLAALHQAGIPARAMVRDPSGWTQDSSLGDVRLVKGSPVDPGSWAAAPGPTQGEGTGTIIHAAGIVSHSRRDPDEMMHVNVEGTLAAVRAAATLGSRVVLISSSGTVGCFRHADIAADEHAPFAEATVGRWPYYASKIRAEREATQLAIKLNVELVIVRLPVLLGPHDHRFRSTGHVTRVLTGRVPFIPSGGMHFTDVRDVASALAKLTQLPKNRARSIYHLPGTASTLGAFFATVGEVSGTPVTERRAPAWLLKTVARATRRIAIPHVPDPVVLEMATCFWGLSTLWSGEELGYTVRNPRQTLVDTITWLRKNHPEIGNSERGHSELRQAAQGDGRVVPASSAT